MNQPPGFVQPGSEKKVCRLRRSLYDLKQAPLCWNFKINAVPYRSGFTRVPSEFGIYVSHEDPRIYVGLYVDDLLILSSSPSKIQTTEDHLSSQFTMKDLGPVQHFLGLDIGCHLHSVSLSLHTYIDQLLSHYDPQLFLRGYCDADWGGNVDRYSTTGYVFVLANAPITCRSKKEATVALSSTEVEYMALGDAVKELLWLKQLLYLLKVRCLKLPTICCDNTSTLALSDHPAYHPETKHLDIRYHLIRTHIQNKALMTFHVP
ncbi:hypothetical protein KL935_005396 [Ogataea polymorpha]|nr:hypothetical protein KL935_005396 [Ogataea polymorpha]